MELTAILSTPGEPLEGSSESPADDRGDAEALIPFAAMLSGALMLLAPSQEAQASEVAQEPLFMPGEAVVNEDTSSALARPLEVVDFRATGPTTPLLETDTASTLPLATDEGQASVQSGTTPESVRLHPRQGLEKITVESLSVESAVGSTLDEASQTLTDTIRLPASASLEGEGEGSGASATQAAAKAAASQDTSVGVTRSSVQAPDASLLDLEATGPTLMSSNTQAAAEAALSQDASPGVTRSSVQEPDAEDSLAGVKQKEGAAERLPGSRPMTGAKAGRQIASVEQGPDPVTRPVVPDTKMVASGMKTADPANTALELDTALPDPEGVSTEKETDLLGRTEAKTKAHTTEDGDVSSDAGGHKDTKGDDAGRSSRSRSARRARAEHAAKTEQSALAGTPRQTGAVSENAASQASTTLETMPEEAGRADTVLPDLDLGLSLPEEHVAPAASDKSTSEATTGGARATRGLFQQNRAVPVAWLRAVLNNARQAVFSEDGWKILEMNLEEGEGTMTIKARREDGRVAVAVGFSDPELRALVSAHADRLQEALQAQYEATVDFSLFNGHADDSGGRQQAHGKGAAVSATAQADADTSNDGSSRRSQLAGAQHEWVG